MNSYDGIRDMRPGDRHGLRCAGYCHGLSVGDNMFKCHFQAGRLPIRCMQKNGQIRRIANIFEDNTGDEIYRLIFSDIARQNGMSAVSINFYIFELDIGYISFSFSNQNHQTAQYLIVPGGISK